MRLTLPNRERPHRDPATRHRLASSRRSSPPHRIVAEHCAPSRGIESHTCTRAWHLIHAASSGHFVLISRIGQKRPHFQCIRDKVISGTDGSRRQVGYSL